MEQFKFTDLEVVEMLRFMQQVNIGWDSDRHARRNLSLFLNKLAVLYEVPTILVPDEGYV